MRTTDALLLLLAAASVLSSALGAVSLAALAVLMVFRAARRRGTCSDRPFATVVFMFTLWGLLMIPFSLEPGHSLVMAKRFGLFAALWAGACLLVDEARRAWLLRVLGGAAVANALLTLTLQDYAFDLSGRRLSMVQNSSTTGAWILAMAAIVLMAFAVVLPGRRWRLSLLAAQVPLGLAVVLSQTRSAWLGLAAGWLLVLLLARRGSALLLLSLLILAYAFGPAAFQERVGSIGDPADTSGTVRLKQWGVGEELVAWRPVTGVGDVYLSDIARIRTGYVDRLNGPDMRHLHHNLVTTAVFWGLPGLGFLLLLLGRVGLLLLRAWRRVPATEPYRRGWALAGLGVWAFFNLVGMVDAPLMDQEAALLFLLICGAGLAGPAEAITPRATPGGNRP